MASSPPSRSARRPWFPGPGTALLLVLAYIPALATAPGVVAADTKQYLYLDPGSFLARARVLWDSSQFGGYVTHQQIGLLWPMGPWFWLCHAVGLPEWVAQRLWVGSLIALAAFGARRVACRLGLPADAAVVVALAYGFSPYLLTYVSRTSVLLLPWAALGWAMVLTIDALDRGGWRAPAALGLLVTTVGSVNATAVALVGIGPLVLAVDAVLARRSSLRTALATAARVAVCCAATSSWWIVALVVEGRFGAAVLRYSETISAVATTSSSPEVVRGLGYWLFYGSLVDGRWNSAAAPYLSNPVLIGLTAAMAAAGLAGLTLLRWRAQRALLWQLAIGVVVAVGAHVPRSPYGALLGGPLARTTIALALRSSTRAVPLVVLSLACGLGAGVAVLGVRLHRFARPIAAGAGALALLQLPALVTGGYVDALLRRPAALPAWWTDTAAELDRRGGPRILELPGQEFAAYRWGTTTDPILPGLTKRGVLTRDLLPLGNDQRMNLLYALDQRFQDGVAEPSSIAPVARLLGASDVVARLDANWARYRTPNPGAVWQVLDGAPGLTTPSLYGPPVAAGAAGLVSRPAAGATAPAAVAVFGVAGTPAPARVEPVAGATILAGDGDGVVDAAAAGLVDGSSPMVYAADLSEASDRSDGGIDHAVLDGARSVIVTDTNRAAARQWRGTQDVVGFTEDGGDRPVASDDADARLQPFGPQVDPSALTVARQKGVWAATASAYGEPNAYRPEERAFRAVDGDAGTAWRVADRADPVGAWLLLRSTSSSAVGGVRLLQPQRPANRHITTVTITTDHERRTVDLDSSSLVPPGQLVALEGASTSSVRVRVDATDMPTPPSFFGLDAVGFAEVTVAAPDGSVAAPTSERVVLPTQLDPATEGRHAAVSVVLTRQRIDPTNRWRSDPERSLVREFRLPSSAIDTRVAARVDARAPDAAIAPLLGLSVHPTASSSSTGVIGERPWSATDGDPATAWTSARGDVIGGWWEAPLAPGASVERITLRLVDDAQHSVPRRLQVGIGATTDEVVLPAPRPDGAIEIALPAPRVGDRLRLTVADADVRTTVDGRYGEDVELPVALAEVSASGIATTDTAAAVDTGCRSDLLTVDGQGIALRVHGATADVEAGRPLRADLCDPDRLAVVLRTGPDHLLSSAIGAATGIDIDRVVLSAGANAALPAPGVAAEGLAPRPGGTPVDYRVAVATAPSARWLVVPDAANAGWTATLDGTPLTARRINGGALAWPLPQGAGGVVHVRWAPQRWDDVALALSVLSACSCAAIVVVGLARRRRYRRRLGHEPTPDDWCVAPAPATVPVPARLGRTPTADIAVALAGGLAVAVFVAPLYGVGTAVLVGLGRRRPHRVDLRFAGPSAVLVGGVYTVTRQLVSRPVAGFGWPTAMNAVHRPVLAGVLVAAFAVVGERVGDGRRRGSVRDRRR